MSSANSAISSHTKYSAKSTNTANQNNQNGAGGAYGSKTKQQIAEEVELAEDDIMKKYLETQDKHRQLMNENSKRRKEKEKKMKEEQEKKRKQEEEMLLKRKETKQQAYVKFLRSNATKVADNLKQNTEQVNVNGNGTKVKSSTANQPKRPTYKVTQLEQNKAVANDQPKPKKQWNTAKTSNQNLVADEKITAQKENRMPVPLAEYYGKQKDSKEKQQEVYTKDMNLDALDLNIPSGKDDFDRIKKMYAKQNHDSNGNDFIVNFEKEWKDDEDSLDNIRQSKLLESLDLSTVKTRKAKNAPPQEPIAVKPKKNIKSQFDDIYENDSYDENEQEGIEEEEVQDKRQKVNQNGVKKGSNENLQTQSKPSRAELLQQMKKGGVSKQNEQEDKVGKDRKNTQPKNINMKNESALVREAIGFDEHFIAEDSDDDDIGTALGFQAKQQQKKPQEKRNSQANESKSNVEEGLTFAKLQKLNEVMEGTVALDNQKYDVLSWAKNQQKEVDDVFSQAPSNLTQNRVKPVSAKQLKDDKKPPILRSNTNNNIYQENKPNNAAQQKKQQEQQDAQSYISEDRMQRQSIRQLSASRNVQKQPEQISPNQQKQNKQQPSERTQITTNIQQQQKGRAQADRSKERQPVPPVMQVPPSKQKYTNIHNNKVNQSHNDGSSEVASSNQGRVSKFKQKLQWNVQNNRRNNTKSPDSVGTRDEDINVDEFLRDDLLNINQEEQQLQQEIYALHFDNVEKIRDIENRNNINLNLVSSKQVKDLENNPSTVVKPIKPIYEYKEEELEQSLLRLDKALVLKKNKPQSANIARQQNGQTGEADNEQFSLQAMYQMQQQLQQNQKGMKQPLQKPNNPQTKQQQVQSGQQFNMNQNIQMLQQQQLQQQQQQQQQLLQQQQLNNAVPNNLIAQQLLILQQQQQLLLQQQQQMAVAQIQNGNLNNIGLNSPPNLQNNNQMNSMKIQQILNVNQLTYQNLAQQNESLTKLEKGYDVNRQEGNAVNQQESRDQSMYISPQFGMIGNTKSNQQLNNNIKNVTGNMSVTSLHSQQQYQSQYNYDINDLQSISQVNSVAPSINPEVRRQKLREELDEEVESKISEMKSKISSNNNNNNNNNKEQQNSYKQKHVIKKDIKQKKGQAQEEKSLKKEIEENPDGMMKFAGNNKLKALLLDDVEEEQDSRHYQDNSFE